jgi:hypothetical protein
VGMLILGSTQRNVEIGFVPLREMLRLGSTQRIVLQEDTAKMRLGYSRKHNKPIEMR